MKSIYQHEAMTLFDLGLKPIPLNGKIPFISGWQTMEITADDVETWSTQYPDCNIGIVCGPSSGILVVDFDDPDEMARLNTETGINLDIVTPTCITKKGLHKYFKYPAIGATFGNRTHLNVQGIKFKIDIRATGGQVVAPPSIHPEDTTFQYHWAEGLAFGEVPLQDLPDMFIDVLTQPSKPKITKKNKKSTATATAATLPALDPLPSSPVAIEPIEATTQAVDSLPSIPAEAITPMAPSSPAIADEIPEGERNDTLFRMACAYRNKGLSSEEARNLIAAVNQTRCRIPLNDEELDKVMGSAFSYVHEHFEMSDRGFAQKVLEQCGNQIKYCIEDHHWYIWNGFIWSQDANGEIKRMADRVADLLKASIQAMPDSDPMKKPYLKYIAAMGNTRKREDMLHYLQSLPGVSVSNSHFDKRSHLLNCRNGVINLRSGELLESNPDWLLTRQIEIEYDPTAACPVWLEFMKTITHDDMELIGYLQRAAGYSITGETNEEVVFFLYGTGCNGKSTFINAINSVLGKFARTMPSKTLMIVQNDNTASNDIAMLKGVRLAATTELPEGKRFNEELIKSLASQDIISARYLFKEYFEFSPTHKWWISGNHKPKIVGQDYGIWRRLKLIPFEITISPEKQDKNLKEKLEAELPGILRWMVEGAVEWYRNGLREPAKISEAVKEYRNEMDILGNFIAECCQTDSDAMIPVNNLYNLYKQYCETNGQSTLGKKMFNLKMVERGFKKDFGAKNQVCLFGIKAAASQK